MVGWILVTPSTALKGRVKILDELRNDFFQGLPHVPPGLFEKYSGHSAVHFTHIFPSALWAAIIPFQLHPGFRQRNRQLHRIMGYTFVATAIIMMMGVVIIIQRGLLFENSLDELPPDPATPVFLSSVSIWFLVTIVMATHEARHARFASHRKWILRHIAAGLWIAVQRVIVSAMTPLFREPLPQWWQAKIFSTAATVGVAMTVLTAEYAIRLLEPEQNKLTSKSS